MTNPELIQHATNAEHYAVVAQRAISHPDERLGRTLGECADTLEAAARAMRVASLSELTRADLVGINPLRAAREDQ